MENVQEQFGGADKLLYTRRQLLMSVAKRRDTGKILPPGVMKVRQNQVIKARREQCAWLQTKQARLAFVTKVTNNDADKYLSSVLFQIFLCYVVQAEGLSEVDHASMQCRHLGFLKFLLALQSVVKQGKKDVCKALSVSAYVSLAYEIT